MDDFSRLVPEALEFFAALAQNNSRDWFAGHKSEYDRAVKAPAEALLGVVAEGLEARAGRPLTPKLYRIHRDLRFAKDKTPYNTHLHLQWADRAAGVCYLFGVSPDYVCAGVGAMAFAEIDRWRRAVAGPEGAALAGALSVALTEGHRVDPPELKRVPAPYPADHPQAELLRRKSLILWHDLNPGEQTDPPGALFASFARMEPLRARLAAILG